MADDRERGPLSWGDEGEPGGEPGPEDGRDDEVGRSEQEGWGHRLDPDWKEELEGGRPAHEHDRDEREEKKPAVRVGGGYSIALGVFLLLILIGAGINTLTNDDSGVLGLDDGGRGEPLSQFAVPAVPGPARGDANVAQDDCETSRLPCPEEDRRTPACRVEGEGVITACEHFDAPLVISFWFSRGGDCEEQQDVVEAVSRRYGDRVGFLSINVRDDREVVERLVRDRGWRLPVGHDRDGAVANLFRVGGCPSFVYAYPGGIVHDTSIGELGEGQLRRRVDALVRASRRREERAR